MRVASAPAPPLHGGHALTPSASRGGRSRFVPSGRRSPVVPRGGRERCLGRPTFPGRVPQGAAKLTRDLARIGIGARRCEPATSCHSRRARTPRRRTSPQRRRPRHGPRRPSDEAHATVPGHTDAARSRIRPASGRGAGRRHERSRPTSLATVSASNASIAKCPSAAMSRCVSGMPPRSRSSAM